MGEFKIYFFRVGNGHCSYLEFSNGKNGLIDIKTNLEDRYDDVIKILRKANISKIDYLWITHPHQDHISGLFQLVQNFNIGIFIYSPIYFKPNPVYDDWTIYEQMKKGFYCGERYEAKSGFKHKIGDCEIEYLAPVDYLLNNQFENINNNGLLLKIVCRGHKIIISGDIEKDGWEYIKDEDIKNSTLLFASHHGNNSGYNLEKIRKMNLAFVVISSGPKTEYDADQKYKNQVRKGVYTTRTSRVVVCIDDKNTLYIDS